MAFTFKELKQARNNVMDSFGLDSHDASKVVGYFNGGGPVLCPDIVTAMINGDLSDVGPALAALGLHTDDKPGKDQEKIGCDPPKIFPEKNTEPEKGKKFSGSRKKNDSDTKKRPVTSDLCGAGDSLQRVQGESKQANKNNPECGAGIGPECCQGQTDDIETDVNPHALPVGLYDDICATIENYCRQYDITEPLKMHPSQWKSLCIYIGQGIKARAILQDKSRYSEVGFCYDGARVAALLDLYEYICGQYKQVPFAYNFMHFAGISRQYFADYGDRLTSGRVNLKQKAYDIQRAGLVEAVTGGGSATVGNIFLSKALAGLQETVTIQHVSAASTPAAVALPVFGPDGGLLEEKRPE